MTPAGRPLVAVVLPPREHFAEQRAGAIALLVRSLARPPSDFDVRVLGPPVRGPFGDAAFVPVRQAWRPAPLAARYAAGVLGRLRRMRPSLVEVHNRPDIARRLARLGVPVHLFLHNLPARIDGAARVFAVSAWLAQASGLPGCEVFANSIDLDALPPIPSAREKLILFAGRVVADKGADAFVDACAHALPRLPGWRAEIIGADGFGPGSRETPFLRRLRPLARAAGVHMSGWQPHTAVLARMARAGIVAVPSRWPEPFGMTALEAMACGAAVAFSPRGGLVEVVGEAGVPVAPEDPAGMADVLVRLALDPERRAALGEAARTRAGQFSAVRARARLDALRREAVAGGLDAP